MTKASSPNRSPVNSTETKQHKLLSIETIRGVAALLIVIHHAGLMLTQDRYGGYHVFGDLYGELHVGVDFFFVLSGFILTWVHWKDLGHRDRLGHYAWRRFTRIYPAYWAILIPLTVLYHLFPNSGQPEQHDWGNFVLSFLLAPFPDSMIIGVAWTLTYEIFFYILFGIVLALGRKGVAILLIWTTGIFLYPLLNSDNAALAFMLKPYGLEFLMGIVAGLVLRRGAVPYAWLLFTVGIVGFFTCMLGRVALILLDHEIASRLIFGGFAMMTLIGCVELERSGRLRIPGWLQLFGAMSYALYLAHPTAQSFMMVGLWKPVLSKCGELADFSALILVGIVAGLFYHLFVERPLTSYVRRRFPAW